MIPSTKRLPVLETEHLKLQPLTEDHAQDVFPLMDDPELMTEWDVPEIDDPEVVAQLVVSRVADMKHGKALYWTIQRLEDEGFVGCCDLTEIDRWRKRAEVGFMLGRDPSSQSYAQQSMQVLVAYAAANGLRQLTARTRLGDRRCETVLETLGFEETGLMRGQVQGDGGRRDCHLFRLLL